MSLLGEDGRGYELARKLEALGVWRKWLGDSSHALFIHDLSSPSTWDAFMRSDGSKSKAQIQLQLRVRALLFDKACVSLFVREKTTGNAVVSKLNPNYLQLHADDVYFTLENSSPDRLSNTASSKSKATSIGASRYGNSDTESISQRSRHDDFPETWYNQSFEKLKASRPYKLSFGERESDKRTPEEMSAYLSVTERHKRKRGAFQEDQSMGNGNSMVESRSNRNSNSGSEASNAVDDDDGLFLPETMFPRNCIPDSALPPASRHEDGRKVEFREIFDMLPPVMTRNAVMIERLGIRPEYLSMEQRESLRRRKRGLELDKNHLSQEQACQMSQKAVAKLLTNVGFEGATEVPMEVLSQLLGCHIRKLGRMLKILADSYRKQCTPIGLLKMFLHTAGYGNYMALAEHVKDATRNNVQQTQQQVHGVQSHMQPQQSPLRIPQQFPRHMHSQMQQMLALQQQQQLERMRRRQQANSGPGMEMDKDRPMVQVKLENPSELPMDGNVFNTTNAKHPQMQLRQQQQLAAISNYQAQPGNQVRQMASLQMQNQMQTPNMSTVRAPPVKVEGFQELMGGDATMKHSDADDKLTSPHSK